MTEPIPIKLDSAARKQLAQDAEGLLENKAFTAAILALRKQWFGELLATDPKYLVQIQARLQALEAIPQQLQIFINDEHMARVRQK